jgi:DNA-binding SARP family transcriptional activator
MTYIEGPTTGAAGTAETGCWRFLLFGRFSAQLPSGQAIDVRGRRIQELLGYVLLFRDRPHHREVLADALWGDEGWSADPKKQLRQALWQLRGTFRRGRETPPFLRVDPEWVELEADIATWTDVSALEDEYQSVKGMLGEDLDDAGAQKLRHAIDLYRADLLEGCYRTWCVYERERLKTIYLALLEKLLGYCEVNGLPEEGLGYGERLLAHDAAHEPTHRRMMRLHWLAGDRVRALRQFERCSTALRDELDIAPSAPTAALLEQIRADAEYRSSATA